MKNKQSSYLGFNIGIIGIIFNVIILMCTSCGMQERIHVISEDGVNWYTTPKPKRVIAKDKDNYGYYLIALEDGSTYYTSFGEYSIIEINDLLELNKKGTKIINIIKPAK